ncbi:MAG TPA: PQQ-binding-like beta-propeller repeat protein [Gemmataceae bacterium]|nr:PQQ-binding-like beta-propeller repeat protein [Gemmataceae bacterium]
MRRTLTFAALIFATPALAADWPQWRGPNRDGVAAEKGLLKSWPKEGPPLAWKIDTVGVGYGSPAVVGDSIYLLGAEDADKGANEFAVCLNAKDGSKKWSTPLGNEPGSYMTGWGSGPRSTPTVDGDVVYVLGAMGDLLALKAATGEKIWSANLVKQFGGKVPTWGYSESVLIDGDKLICTPGGKQGSVACLDKKLGTRIWQSAEVKDAAHYSSVIATDVGGVRQYLTQTGDAAIGVRAADGKLLWRINELKRTIGVIPTPVVHDGLAFFTAGYGAGCELFKLESNGGDTKATVVYTKNKAVKNHHGGVIRAGDHIYGHSDGNGWVCFDYKKGPDEPEWKNGFEKGSVTFADGNLYCYGERTGTLVLVPAMPQGWNEVGRLVPPAKSKHPRRSGAIWAHPVIANGKLYLRDHELLFCYDIAAR